MVFDDFKVSLLVSIYSEAFLNKEFCHSFNLIEIKVKGERDVGKTIIDYP